jgi:hypothetical protein
VFGHQFGDRDLPTEQTALNIADEGQVLSNIQVVEKLAGSTNAPLHTDGTSCEHKKFISQRFTLDSGETLSLGFATAASEDAATLLDLTIAQLDQLASLYAQYK